MNLVAPIFNYAEKNPDQLAIVDERSTINYRTLAYTMGQVMIGLNKYNKPQMAVGVLAHTHREVIETLCGAVAAGHIIVVLDPKWSQKQLKESLKHVDILFIDEQFRDLVRNHTTVDVIPYRTSKSTGTFYYTDWRDLHTGTFPTLAAGDTEPFYIGFTSGTTSNPKAFIRHHQSWIESFTACHSVFKIDQNSHVVAPGSIVHSLFLFAVFHALFNGATLYVLNQYSSAKSLKLIQNHPVSHMYLVPTMAESLLASLEPSEQHTQPVSLITSGDKLTTETKGRLQNAWPDVQLFEFYGASELSFVSVSTPSDHLRNPESVGKPFPSVQLEIRDDSGNPLPPEQIGTLHVKSNMLFSGYINDDNETANVLIDGWAVTGDLAKLSHDGDLYLVGRKKNRIISGGWNIFPEKIETIVKTYSDLHEVAVIGLQSRFWGEIPVLVITEQSNGDQQSTLRSIYKEHLPRHEWPRRTYTIDAFPYTSSGKIARARLKELIQR
ncbi:AMP-binding protein [Geomicrobium sp. JCM 19055]|uniref:AMP-binding protein n=1 Tax=Geomicrobium sp. JCM 19055 TaxID=1460649 RepID=UPI00045ED185|nr:AMP-binding protein [Geomicrobium sp. JCM 19055]GAJ98902.1 long-chain-fatty-acid-CoA ligase [Geomicrobium sp. JCM 19055]